MNKLLHFKKVVLVLLLLVGALNVYSQHVVTGKVIDEQGPLIGASVTIKDAAVPTGTVTTLKVNTPLKFLTQRPFWFIRISVTLIRQRR